MSILIQDGDTALHNAAYTGHTETVDHLVSAVADVNITNNVSQYVVFMYVFNYFILYCYYTSVFYVHAYHNSGS